MDFLSITPSNNSSLTAANVFSGAGEPTISDIPILRPPKRPVGRPKGSKNKAKKVPPPPKTRSLNFTAVVETRARKLIDNNRILRRGKRPVGRPKGSKNKPKTVPQPPIKINSETVIEIPAGANIVQSLLQFCRRHQVSVTVLNASGQLANIILYNEPNTSIPGPFLILSLSGTVVPAPPPLSGAINSPEIIFPLPVLLSSPNGAVCGMVGRSATAASIVKVVAITTTTLINNVTFETVCDDLANNSNVEISPIANVPPQNLQFSEFYRACNSGDLMKNPMQLYDDSQKEKDEEQDLMMNKSNNVDLMIDEDIWRYEENLTPALRVEPYRF